MSKLTSEATYVPTMLAEHPNLKTYDYFSEEEKEFSVSLKYHLRDMVFYKDQSLWPYSIDVDATSIFDPVLDWIGQTVEHGWMVRAEYLHGQYVFRFSFDDLQEATLFRLRF